MKASQIQQVLKSQAGALTNLYSEYRTLRTSRATYNAEADKAAAKGNDEHAELYLFQAEVFSPYIRKMKVKIAKLEEAQKALKGLLGHAQAIEAFCWVGNASWTMTNGALLQFADNTDGVAWQGNGEEFLAKLEEG